ncbi:uncharacterized protein ACFDR9_003628 [Janthinobacterium sp. CG_23.3]|uniref:DUF1289 domain-containing protein n=1 Tax=unclassified Janthinobacterium TaxID=2610881 RepID=UPI0003499127|nr:MULTISPECIES: DUF1289 domain-containing protein [unclassified Janthinobacterium]MEC5162883.1 putative Fe-S protein YdhL (DUF1289 family) [Janthinobacterium sp. CG_S6]
MALKSPCIELCAFDGPTGFCLGCTRTLEEARAWKKMTDFKRHQIINDSARRKKKIERALPAAAS